MITVEDFKKLMKLECQGYHIFVNDDEVYGLIYDEEEDIDDDMKCTFTFVNDRYDVVLFLSEYKDSTWTVKEHKIIDWKVL